MGQETQAFKVDVRKLKTLDLTESLGAGYRLSPRGRSLLASLQADADRERGGRTDGLSS